MSTTYRYVLPVEQTEWKFDGSTETCFTWEYDEPREALLDDIGGSSRPVRHPIT